MTTSKNSLKNIKLKKLSNLVIPELYDALNQKAAVTTLFGSRASGKTRQTAIYVTKQVIQNKGDNAAVVRQVADKLMETIWADFVWAIKLFGYEKRVEFKLTDAEIHFPNGNVIIFRGVGDPFKFKGQVKSEGEFRYFVVEEASNIPSLEAFHSIRSTVTRGKKGRFQTIVIMNTELPNWATDYFCEEEEFWPDLAVLENEGFMSKRVIKPELYRDWMLTYSSIFLNYRHGFIDDSTLNVQMELKGIDYDLFTVSALGNWGALGGSIYKGYLSRLRFVNFLRNLEIIEYTFGIDYGEKNSATTCVLIGLTKGYKEVVILDMYYWKNGRYGFKNAAQFRNEIIQFIDLKIRQFGIKRFKVIVDSAAEVFRQTINQKLEDMGFQNYVCWPTRTPKGTAGKFPILERIQLIKSLMAEYRIYVYNEGNNKPLIDEWKRTVWDENKTTLTRLDQDNDAQDAFEYALVDRYRSLYTTLKGKKKKAIETIV